MSEHSVTRTAVAVVGIVIYASLMILVIILIAPTYHTVKRIEAMQPCRQEAPK